MPINWNSVQNYKRSDFAYPDKLQLSIVDSLDRFTSQTGLKAQILDDYRAYTPGNPDSRHAHGDALDLFFPGKDPLGVLAAAEGSGLFDGIGIYLNERGAVSFHFDKRGSRARWGSLITPELTAAGEPIRKNNYTTLEAVVAKISELTGRAIETVKKNPIPIFLAIGALLFLLSKKR